MSRRRSSRGMTLIEAMVSVVVMATAVAAIFGMINRVEGANRTVSFQNIALDAFARVAAQVRGARCDYSARVAGAGPGSTDPGLVAGMGTWVGAGGPVAGSSITFVGDGTNNPELLEYSTPIRIDYRTTAVPNSAAATHYTVEVRIRQIMRDAARDNAARESGFWIRVFPVEKHCTARIDAIGRGVYQ